jgi:hypothetical protein
MANYEYLNLDSAAYDVFTGGTIGIPISEREGAIISTMLLLLTKRVNWGEMTDLEWSAQEEEIQDLIERLTP